MGANGNHTPITGTPNLRTALNTALGELDSAIGNIGLFNAALMGHSVANGTDGGTTANTTWNTRPISGLEVDSDAIVAISSNQFTPSAGNYVLVAQGFMRNVSFLRHRMRLYNATQTSAVFTALSIDTNDTLPGHLMCIFTANGTDAYEIQTYSSHGATDTGMGFDDSAALGNEVYLQAILTRIGAG